DEDATRLAAGEQPAVRPGQRFTVDVLLQHLLVEEQAERSPAPTPRHVGALDDDVLERIQASGILEIPVGRPLTCRRATVPVARREAEHLALDAASLEHLR